MLKDVLSMVDFEAYTSRLREKEWHFDENLADHLKRKGHSLSHAPFIKSALKAEIEREDGPLSGMDLQHDAYEMQIIMRVVGRLIDEHL